jgi:(1->4)-alpha-D-glucan 1-alpha-D-glucosylmutase
MGDVEGTAPPDRADEYMLYQLLIGSWPAELTGRDTGADPGLLAMYTDRVKAAMTKSVREAKLRSTWASPDLGYEGAIHAFIDAALNPEPTNAFLSAFLPFQERIAELGVHNSLAQTTLKLTSPGVPDTYQGAELWDLSLVDPDNRRPVDYQERERLLDLLDTEPPPPAELLGNWKTGAVKLFLIQRLLRLRKQHPEVFAEGSYEPLLASGPGADAACAFIRRTSDRAILVAMTRFPLRNSEAGVWEQTTIAAGPMFGSPLRNILTGTELDSAPETLTLKAILGDLPVAILFTQILASPEG